MPKVNPIPSSEFDLATRGGRRRANRDLVWGDHGFLRAAFSNFHWIEPGKMARANQPAPSDIDRYGAAGVKTVLNLRGKSDTGYYVLEKEACERNGMVLVDQRMHSRQPPSREQVRQAKHLFQSIEYPALMHCKSGADRAGAMAVLYAHFAMGQPIERAIAQLSLKYLHVKQGKTGMIDFFFQSYLDAAKLSGKPFLQWVEEDYDMKAVIESFHSQWWANLLVDRILRRE